MWVVRAGRGRRGGAWRHSSGASPPCSAATARGLTRDGCTGGVRYGRRRDQGGGPGRGRLGRCRHGVRRHVRAAVPGRSSRCCPRPGSERGCACWTWAPGPASWPPGRWRSAPRSPGRPRCGDARPGRASAAGRRGAAGRAAGPTVQRRGVRRRARQLRRQPRPRPAGRGLELARVTAPGGRVGVTIWPSGQNTQSRLWAAVIAESGAVVSPSVRLPADLDFPRTREGLAGLLAGAGLRVVDARPLVWVHRTEPDALWRGAAAGRRWHRDRGHLPERRGPRGDAIGVRPAGAAAGPRRRAGAPDRGAARRRHPLTPHHPRCATS